jgi:hypothetical protein
MSRRNDLSYTSYTFFAIVCEAMQMDQHRVIACKSYDMPSESVCFACFLAPEIIV